MDGRDKPGRDTLSAAEVWLVNLVKAFLLKGLSALLVEQNMRSALKIADRAYVLRVGSIVRQGTAGEIADAPDIQEAYLGA